MINRWTAKQIRKRRTTPGKSLMVKRTKPGSYEGLGRTGTLYRIEKTFVGWKVHFEYQETWYDFSMLIGARYFDTKSVANRTVDRFDQKVSYSRIWKWLRDHEQRPDRALKLVAQRILDRRENVLAGLNREGITASTTWHQGWLAISIQVDETEIEAWARTEAITQRSP